MMRIFGTVVEGCGDGRGGRGETRWSEVGVMTMMMMMRLMVGNWKRVEGGMLGCH